MGYANFEDLQGKRIKKISVNSRGDDEIIFETYCGKTYKMYHEQDCCEQVFIASIEGDISALEGRTILRAEESTGSGFGEYGDSFTWTFYKLISDDAVYVTIRWNGESNGYYSESVDFVEIA